MGHAETDLKRRWQRRWGLVLYVALIGAVSYVFGESLELVRIRGGFVFPPWFKLFRVLFYVQFGVFGGACLSLLLFLLPRLYLPLVLRALILGGFFFFTAWLCTWGLTQSAYGIELTGRTVWELFTNPVAFGEMGLGPREFFWIAVASFLFIAVLTAASLVLSSRLGPGTRGRVFALFFVLFLVLHIPVRAYFVFHINRGSYAVLAYDDCAPFPLHSERLLPYVRANRVALPNFESAARTKAYFEFVDTMRMPPIPRRHSIVWISVESLRFDAINERAMPRLFALRDQFQIRLDRNHWSGGNATQFGIFSMLTGLSGAHFGESLRAKRSAPFLELLAENNYRLRVANNYYLKYGGLFRLMPDSAILVDFLARPRDEGDRRMLEMYFQDRESRDSRQPTFDFLSLDATHWPYFYPESHRRFQPDPAVTSSMHVFRSQADLQAIRNRYDNACYFVDEQIALVLGDLKTRGEFENTIVIIVGDHGEEFQERGQITHAAGLNDFQGRTLLWMHFPEPNSEPRKIDSATVHMDIVPTLLQALGFDEDVLYTQGRSLLSELEPRAALPLCEQGFTVPLYRALVTDTHISRWLRTPRTYLFSGVQRRDGANVDNEDWLREARAVTAEAASMYELPPDVAQPPRRFQLR
jgi:glucan phosphoethanolaminetransferase (alkaline phosphatase superfamily)